jgi:putative transposase
VNEADLPNTINRNFNGYAPRTHIVSGLAYARIGGRFHYVCLLADLSNGEAVGHSAGLHKNAGLVKAAFATIPFALADIEAFHTGGGSEFDDAAIGGLPEAFGMERSLSRKGNPYGNAVTESTGRILKRGFACRGVFVDLHDFQGKPNDCVCWYGNNRMHSTSGNLSPVDSRGKSLRILSQ